MHNALQSYANYNNFQYRHNLKNKIPNGIFRLPRLSILKKNAVIRVFNEKTLPSQIEI